MDRTELIKQTLRWVWGACILWNQQAKQFNSTDDTSFLHFVHRTHAVVFRYLRGNQVLDGTWHWMR